MDETTPAASPGRTVRSRRVGQALALFTAPWCLVVADTGDVLTAPSGMDDTTARGALTISAAHPAAETWLSGIAMLGCLLLIPAVLGAMSLVRDGATWVGLVGLALIRARAVPA